MESNKPLRLAVIVGSVRAGRFGPTVSTWFAEEARKYGSSRSTSSISPRPTRTARLLPGLQRRAAARASHRAPRSVRTARAADAFVIVTPEYNHSFPASLKNTIDWFGSEWHAKPVGFVSYGGMAGGQRAVEQLRQVFAELHAVTVRHTLSFHMAWERFAEDGRPA